LPDPEVARGVPSTGFSACVPRFQGLDVENAAWSRLENYFYTMSREMLEVIGNAQLLYLWRKYNYWHQSVIFSSIPG
jgi:hypothetical protein